MSDETLLVISGDGMPPYSVRGITQKLAPIEAAKNQRRTVNFVLVNISPTRSKLYRTEITCTDQQSPAFDVLEVGDVVTVHCVEELAFKTTGGSPARAEVPSSSRVEGEYTFYRPILTMMVVDKSQSRDEYGAAESWSLTLEELGPPAGSS